VITGIDISKEVFHFVGFGADRPRKLLTKCIGAGSLSTLSGAYECTAVAPSDKDYALGACAILRPVADHSVRGVHFYRQNMPRGAYSARLLQRPQRRLTAQPGTGR